MSKFKHIVVKDGVAFRNPKDYNIHESTTLNALQMASMFDIFAGWEALFFIEENLLADKESCEAADKMEAQDFMNLYGEALKEFEALK